VKKIIFAFISVLLITPPMFAAAPVCLYQDVLSGPATGGEGGNGIYLSIFGKNFGSTQGTSTVTVNGKPVAQYLVWGSNNDVTGNHDQISVQISGGTTGTGNVVVTTPGGTCSNLTFTVRSGKIWFIGNGTDNDDAGTIARNCAALENGTAGNGEGGSGTYASPWKLTDVASVGMNGGSANHLPAAGARTPYMYYQCMALGDTLVFLNGANYPYYDGSGLYSSLALNRGLGSKSSFFTFMARPGASVQLGGTGYVTDGVRDYADTNVVVSGLKMTGSGPTSGQAFAGDPSGSETNPPNVRLVGNILTCPDCSGSAAVLTAGWIVTAEGNTANVGTELLGNWVYDAGCSDKGGVTNKEYHFIYTSGSGEEIAYNRVGGTGATGGCAQNGIQVNYYDDNSIGFGDLSVHDNDVSYANGAGINMATMDPGKGPINVYNNVVHHTGLQPASDNASFFTCLAFPGYSPSASAGTVDVFNNTCWDTSANLNNSNMYDSTSCAVYVSASAGQTNLTVNLVNNIFAQPAYTHTSSANVYLCGSGTSQITGSNNLFYSGAVPKSTSPTSSLTSLAVPTAPLFTSAVTPGPWTNLELQSSSPVIKAGSTSLYSALDFAGKARKAPPTIGALEVGGASLGVEVTVSVAPSQATLEEPITLTATVAQTGSSVPTGSINFLNGSVSLGQASLDSEGTATLVVSSLSVGTYKVIADYSGDSNYPAGDSGYVTLQVISTSQTNLAASSNPITAGLALALTATVEGSGSTVPGGSVKFLNGSALLGTATLNSSGVATLSTTSLASGANSLTAQYTGSTSYGSSTSPEVSVTVEPATTQSTTTTLVAYERTVTVGLGLTLKATVTVKGSSAPATGTVSFMSGSTLLGTATLNSSGVGMLVTSSLTTGTDSLTVVYSGGASFLSSTSAAVSVLVKPVTVGSILPFRMIFGRSTSSQMVLPSETAVSALDVTGNRSTNATLHI